MKKLNTLIVLSLGVLLLTVSCKKEDKAAAATAQAPVTKDLFSADWSVSNNAWELDYRLGNLTGNVFNSTVTYSFNGTCNCTSEMSGSQTSGSFEQNCSVGIQVSSQPDASTCDGLDYVAGSSYTNNSGILNFCRGNGGSCTLSYH